MAEEIKLHISQLDILDFQPNHGCMTELFMVLDDVCFIIDVNNLCILVLLDSGGIYLTF